MLPRLAMLKAACGLNAATTAIEIDGGEVEVVFVESGFEAGNFGTEPAGNLAVGVNRDANLTLLDNGVNLNRAGAIINYDIPWNPTRVIQRLGRINRIGKKVFQSLYLYNFFPRMA